ncbi:MAG: NDP-sugar synthase [Chlorobiaceae bacterium]|nr:NDP-sugar synthase [Chlorobiaceae bacterium]
MKTLIVIKEKDCQWAHAVFPDIHPFLLTICNKPYVEFLIDFSLLSGIRHIRIVSDGPIDEVEEYCENGSRWGAEISYASIQSGDDIQTVLAKNKRFCAEDRCLIINGMVFINYGKQTDYNTIIAALPAGDILSCSCGSLTLTGNPSGTRNISPPYPFSLSCIDSPSLYYRLSNDILNDAVSPYVLPGYNNEPLCHIGRNVVIGKSAEIIKPVILGDNVQIQGGAVIGPGAIIGSNVIIDRNSSVIHSVVLDHTYIGEQLEVEKKIASGNMLIEPESGVSLAIEDPHLLTGIRKTGASLSLLQYAVQALAALIILVLQLIPFLFLFPVLKLRGKWMQHNEECYADISGKILNLSVTAIERGGLFGSIAIFLSLDRFFLLFRVLAGQIAIIGSTPLRVNPENREHLKRMPGYRPGVFSYAEAEAWPVDYDDKAIIERFYAAHSALFQDILMTVKAFVNRIHEKSTP